ncbi:CDP-diacylglycerol--glycerol-3-phosphate 3-phosphatidyltransferase [Mycoplasma sp. 480]|uniref:CDP-diacylglycerol--glycerol-3-phosphate 3-phosphatidyltransferase n=1 Tax=Mycoplasma sp. 480 TaxID=3440155 RepID=UPI003F51A465
MSKKKNIPNYLTIFRMILWIPFVILLVIYYNNAHYKYAFKDSFINFHLLAVSVIIFLLAMFTDFLDGYLARKWNVVSNFGKLFDPIADKVITTTALIFLGLFNFTEIWVVIVFIVRDIVVDGCRNLAAKNNLNISASIWGKWKTFIQSFAIPFLFWITPFFINNTNWVWIYWVVNIPLFIALIFSLFSGFLYVKEMTKILKK